MSATPAARPSMLSSRLNAWHRPANQIVARACTWTAARRRARPASENTRNAPIASDATSLASGDSCRRSSKMPTTNIATAAPRHRQPRRVGSIAREPHAHEHAEGQRALPPAIAIAAHRRRRRAVPAIGPRRHDGADRLAPARRTTAQKASEATSGDQKGEGEPVTERQRVQGRPSARWQTVTRVRSHSDERRRSTRMPSQIVSRPADAPGRRC